MLIDSHCHLNFPDFTTDINGVIERAGEAGVHRMISICTKMSDVVPTTKVAALSQSIFISVGIHPCNVGEEGVWPASSIKGLCAGRKVVAIGETGLDYHYPDTNKSMQVESFNQHIIAAQDTGLPLIVHTRDAGDDTLQILAQGIRKKEYSGVIHCFTESIEFATHALELGLYISFSGIVTFKNAKELQEVAKMVPLERMLVETDAPYLAPMPHRGKRNEPAFVRHTAEFLCNLKGVHYDEFCAITTNNFYKLFSKVPR